jgi:hypothetical protein
MEVTRSSETFGSLSTDYMTEDRTPNERDYQDNDLGSQ